MIRLSLQTTWAHKRRLVGTFLAVLIGVGFLSGTLVLGDTLTGTAGRSAEQAYAGVDVVVRPDASDAPAPGDGDGVAVARSFDASIAEDVGRVRGVGDVEPRIEQPVQPVDGGAGLLGGGGAAVAAAWPTRGPMTPYRLAAGSQPSGPDEVVLDEARARRDGRRVGDSIALALPSAVVDLRVVGLARFGDGTLGPGPVHAFFDPDVASTRLLGAPGRITSLVVAADGVEPDELRSRVAAILGSGVEAVTRERAVSDAADATTASSRLVSSFLVVFACIALFVATFSIYNTFSIVVAQRLREAALLRALGATRGQVRRAALVEALLIGLVASAAGVVVGVGFAWVLVALLPSLGVDVPASGLAVEAGNVVLCLAVGLGVTFVAALLPAARGGRVRPIEALRATSVEPSVPTRRRTIVGVLLASVGGLLIADALSSTDSIGSAGAGAAFLFVAVIVLGPVVARPAAVVLGSPIAALAGPPGELSRENAGRNPRRTASTAAALLIGVTIVVLFSVIVASLKTAITAEVDRSFGADLVVTPGAGLGFLPPALGPRVARLEGVQRAVPVAVGPVRIAGDDGQAFASDVAALTSFLDLGVVRGSLDRFGPNDLALSEDGARDAGVQVGDAVRVAYPDGFQATHTLVAVFRNSGIVERTLLPKRTYVDHSRRSGDAMLFVQLEDGADPAAVRRHLAPLLRGAGDPEVLDRSEFTEQVAGILNQFLAVVLALLALAIVIAAIGIANTMGLSVHERRRELGLLRAVGSTRAQLRRMVRGEAVIVSTFGTLGGLGLGLGLGWVLTHSAEMNGGALPFSVPVVDVAATLLLGIGVGVLAAWLPSHTAARLDILTAVEG